MTSIQKLNASIKNKNSLLCIGLDSDISKLPSHFEKNINGIFEFNKTIINATSNLATAYKINFAFYEQYGKDGFDAIKQTIDIIDENIFIIADAKRGDIGNTSAAYSKSVFDFFNADAITVNPYMGFDSIDPFIEDTSKFVFLLALTSNKGSADFQRLICAGKPLFQHVIEKSVNKYSPDNLGFVVGATHPKELAEIRNIIPQNCILIPGVGTQGGDVAAVMQANQNAPALINVSRAIIYPENITTGDFAGSVKELATKYYNQLKINHKQ